MELASFKNIFDRHYDQIRNFLYYRTGDIELSEDIVQEVFLKLWENRERIREESIAGYLYTIASNLLKNHYRKREVTFRFLSTLTPESEEESPQFLLEFREFDRLLQQTLASMPERGREVFLMNRIDGLTYKEIAVRLRLSVKAVEKRMHQALEHLKKHLDRKI